ncbi:MAG: hypothetical protein KAX55_01605 [Propionivibrio sp.]|nr:hypothetical protein [Propionivibrio sp.]
METRKVSQMKALELTALLNRASNNAPVGEGFHAIKHKPGVLLVDAMNRDPFVFVAPDTVHEFVSQPGSGTDHLRQRMLAGQFFESLEPGISSKLDDPLKVERALLNIQTLLEEANNVFGSLSPTDQNVLTDFHNAEGSISLTLRNGLTATDELLDAIRPARTLENQAPDFEP